MKLPHLLCIDLPADVFAPLFAAARTAGLRLGWLELRPPESDELAPALEGAAAQGALRAVAVGGGRSVAVKPLRGDAVLRDVLREHFRGCAAVLVRGEVGEGHAAAAAQLTPSGDAWRLEPQESAARRLSAADLVELLRRPKPWE